MTSALYQEFTWRDLRLGREVLSQFVVHQAEQTATEVGFGWRPCPDAPNRYDVLQRAYAHSVRTGACLPISSANQDSVVFTSSEVNVAMRFLHDVNHCRRKLSFALPDELELGLWHLSELEAAGFAPHTTVWRLLHADLIGQATVMAYVRRFPHDQAAFVRGCISHGFDRGLLSELRRSS